jgi:secondary thiamine-phosphate synthase enzyme
MPQRVARIEVPTPGRGVVEITPQIRAWLRDEGIFEGLLTVLCRHTSASLLVQGREADMLADLEAFLGRLAPEGPGLYGHTTDGPDDMPAHIRAALTQAQVSLPVADGDLLLGPSQGIFLYEHRTAPQQRHALLHLLS